MSAFGYGLGRGAGARAHVAALPKPASPPKPAVPARPQARPPSPPAAIHREVVMAKRKLPTTAPILDPAPPSTPAPLPSAPAPLAPLPAPVAVAPPSVPAPAQTPSQVPAATVEAVQAAASQAAQMTTQVVPGPVQYLQAEGGGTTEVLVAGADFSCTPDSCRPLTASAQALFQALQQAINSKFGQVVLPADGVVLPDTLGALARILGRSDFALTDVVSRPAEFTRLVQVADFVPPATSVPVAGKKPAGLWWKVALGVVGVAGASYFAFKDKN